MKKKLLLFWTFFKIGSFTLGGGFAMIPLIEREIVEKRGWISTGEMVDILTISQSFPGAVAVNSAIFIGRKIGGYSGALLSLLGVTIPSFSIIIIIAKLFLRFRDISVLESAFKAISSAVVSLLIIAAIRVAKTCAANKISPFITITALLLLLLTGIHPIYIIISGVLLGLVIFLFKNRKKKTE
jgi:chromate transporter